MSGGGLRWAILGTGLIAGKQTDDLMAAGFTVSAVGSRSIASAEEFAAAKGIPTAHGSYEDLVADPDVDIVYVATPATAHVQNGLLALEAGKHVLMEKPFTVSGDEAQLLADRAASVDRVLLEALWTRFLPHMARIREIIAHGGIGRIRTIIADCGQRLPDDPDHRINRNDLAGGALLDIGIYPITLAIDLLGDPSSAIATADVGPTNVDQQTAVVLQFPDGAQAICHTAIDVRGTGRAVIFGTEGMIEIDATFYAPTSFTVRGEDGSVKERYENTVRPRGMQYQAQEMERLVLAGERVSPLMPLAQSVRTMRLFDDIRRQTGVVLAGR